MFRLNFFKFIREFLLSRKTVLFAFVTFSFPAFSQELLFEAANKTITSVGAQGDSYYFRIEGGLVAQCAYALIYIPSHRKALYVQIISAKLTGKKLSRLAYTLSNGPNSECIAYIVEIE